MDSRSTKRAPGHAALLVIDMINDFECEDCDALLASTEQVAKSVRKLCADARAAGTPIVYVNDNFGQWHSERSRLIEHCCRPKSRGRQIVNEIMPERDDYFVIKPQFSGFYATNLPVLLPKLGASRLILTGIAADMCVLFTAADAHMRDYGLWVPTDCVASSLPEHKDWALELMRKSMQAEVRQTSELALSEWISRDRLRNDEEWLGPDTEHESAPRTWNRQPG